MIGDELKELVFKRTGISASDLQCPREKSDMTPCVARDGDLAMTDDLHCAGCDARVAELLDDEKSKE